MFRYRSDESRRGNFRKRWARRLRRLLLALLLLPVLLIAGMRWINPPTTAFMIETKIALYLQDAPKKRLRQRWVDYEDISQAMRLAAVAAEDQNFPNHGGFDWKAISRARSLNQRSRNLRGASTISQQVAKNLFLWQGRSWLRKGIEAYLTLLIETFWPKQRILEVYLNIAQFDQRIFGVDAAAKTICGTTASRLNSSQAALLAAVLPSPVRYHAAAPSPFVRSRQYGILGQMARLGPGYLDSIERR
jgi:monofunctional biosynthetic peptidoglycan transglycosylase